MNNMQIGTNCRRWPENGGHELGPGGQGANRRSTAEGSARGRGAELNSSRLQKPT